jgi:hypothetical protein
MDVPEPKTQTRTQTQPHKVAWSAPCGLPCTKAAALCEWLCVGTDQCARDYGWFEQQAADGKPVRLLMSCVSPPHRAQAPVKYEHEHELDMPGDLSDTAKVSRRAWGAALRTAREAKAWGTRLLLHSPDGLVAALLGAAVVLAIEGPGALKPVWAALCQWLPTGDGCTYLGTLQVLEDGNGEKGGTGASRFRFCLRDD